MGTHANSSSRRKTHKKQSYKRFKKRLAKKNKALGFDQKVSDIADPELMTIHHLKKRRTSTRTNITLSGKKKHKLLKQLKHATKEKTNVDVEDGEASGSKMKKAKFRDVAMHDAEEEDGEEEGSEGGSSAEEDVDMEGS